MDWLRRHWKVAITVIVPIVLVGVGFWFWGVLVDYVEPKDSTGRKDVVQVFALLMAGVVGVIGGIVSIANLQTSRRNLQQQIDLEEQRRQSTFELEVQRRQATYELEVQRRQDAAMQSYFEQMGDLLTDHDLIGTDREDIRQLAQAQTLTVLARLDGPRKGSLVRFLYGSRLIDKDRPIVQLVRADLSGTYLSGAYLNGADLSGADLSGAYLGFANLSVATVSEEQLAICRSLEDATMPNGKKYEGWRKTNE